VRRIGDSNSEGAIVTPQHRALVLETADAAFAIGRFADRFYARLFALAPETQALFGDDSTILKLKFMNTMTSIVGSVERPEMFSSILTHLGRRHRRFGVLSAHYTPVGTALLETLEDILEERFTPPVRGAWAALYAEIAARMQEGAREAG
jgi:hemoglobin-like flavoprotein